MTRIRREPPSASRRALRFPAWLGLAAALLGGSPPAPAAEPAPTRVILVSLDGTRPADLREEDLPTLAAVAEQGARAQRLIPVFPTNTFPNHASLATGVRPGVHGIVDNDFVDPVRGDFDRGDIVSFVEVEPLWSLLERRGIPTASFHWVGSEGAVPGGRAPAHWKAFDSRTPVEDKVDQVLAWLDLEDPARRPRLITTWFPGADRAGHRHGPGTPEVRKALRAQEPALARLVKGVERRGILASTTLLFVSDHGMALREGDVSVDDVLESARIDARVLGVGGFAKVYLAQPERDAPGAVEALRTVGLQAWPRAEAPAALGLDHPRFGHVVVVAPPGRTVAPRGLRGRRTRGLHGWPPTDPRMAAILLALGRGARPGTDLGEVSALDVAPTVLALLGVPAPAWMEGRPIEGLLPLSSDAGGAP